MMEPVKINTLEIENVKRIKAVQLTPAENGLTIIGGRNAQGKTSVLDGIAWALGGDRFKPAQPKRADAVANSYLKIRLSNGLIVERRGENSALKVTDPHGNRGGQQLLNAFVEQLALNLPKFMQANDKEKANTLLKIIGVGDRLFDLETEEDRLYNRRHDVGVIADQKKKHAKEMPVYPGVPKEPLAASELIAQQQEILARNGENARKRERLTELERQLHDVQKRIGAVNAELADLLLSEETLVHDVETARKTAAELQDESTAELEQNIADIEALNIKIRANLEREKAEIDAEGCQKEYDALTDQINAVRQQKRDLLNGADLPLPGLSVEDGALTYRGFVWENLSASEQLKVAAAIVRRLNPQCGFVLMDKLEQMDTQTLREFGAWLEQEGLQAIATRVSTGDECSILIEDGASVLPEPAPVWKAGTF